MAPELAVVRARAVWLEVVEGVRGSSTALMERLDALTDPERVEEANMLAGWRAKYENEITERMKAWWWQRLARRRDVGQVGGRWNQADEQVMEWGTVNYVDAPAALW